MRPFDVDKIILDTLKAVHNRGASLYNAGGSTAAFHVYLGALLLAKPFLSHRVALQKEIDDGLAEVEISDANEQLKAFRLHEVIDHIRSELKLALKKPSGPLQAPFGWPPVIGRVVVGKTTAADVTVAFIALDSTVPAATTFTQADGSFRLAEPLPPGPYTVTLAGPRVPTHYQFLAESPLRVDLTVGINTLLLEVV